VDSEEQYRRIPEFIRNFMPGFYCTVDYYKGSQPIFDAFGIEAELQRALQRRVDLTSGGHLVIDQTEALTAVDVNTGKFVGKSSSLEETITATNLEAVEEIVYQLRLRNIGGLVVLDLIDMDKRENREKVYQALLKALERDKARSNILKISDFGLVEMTRKRVKESLVRQLCEPCAHCEGSGRVKAEATVAYEILRRVNYEAAGLDSGEVHVHCHPRVSKYLKDQESGFLDQLSNDRDLDVHLRASRSMHPGEHRTTVKNGKGDRNKGRGKGRRGSQRSDEGQKNAEGNDASDGDKDQEKVSA
ncbi:MAG: ribonuclease E/G, partial [Myxococcales bacterium]|nr:ribonuclease E/G [Myxococcales bacterium]